MNDKGLVTQDRKTKKDAYFFYQANWTDKPMVHISSEGMTPRQHATTQIEVFSNCGKVNLSVNGGAQPSVPPDNVKVYHWPCDVRPGRNVIIATATCSSKTSLTPANGS